MLTREEMVNKIISKRGFEDKYTILFAEMAEDPKISDETLEVFMVGMLSISFEEEEEE